jgi:plasmid stabilization system protein ParE
LWPGERQPRGSPAGSAPRERNALAVALPHSQRQAKGCNVPQKSWSNKDERQYEHIKDSAEDRGASEDRAKEIAARTVNKQRREEGRTQNKRTMGTGNPNKPLEERTRDELYNIAKDKDIQGRGSMKKSELVDAIRDG